MERFITDEELGMLKKEYPKGTRIVLIKMYDMYRNMERGLMGTVDHIDDVGTIHMKWDNGSSLGLVYQVDNYRKAVPITVTCYREKEEWDDYEKALNFYQEGMAATDVNSSEHCRYSNIVSQIIEGVLDCNDYEGEQYD